MRCLGSGAHEVLRSWGALHAKRCGTAYEHVVTPVRFVPLTVRRASSTVNHRWIVYLACRICHLRNKLSPFTLRYRIRFVPRRFEIPSRDLVKKLPEARHLVVLIRTDDNARLIHDFRSDQHLAAHAQRQRDPV